MLQKILIANRGEIALRIMRTCEDLGVGTVAVFSEVDRASPHVRYADEAYLIGPGPAIDSYLNIEKLLEVAKQARVEGIHPGYGFLAENAEFARRCSDAGFKFIGPTPENLSAIATKFEARRFMQQAGLPVIPGAEIDARRLDTAKRVAAKVGYPLLVKAVAGGGGKGIRLVSSPDLLEDAVNDCAREASASFANPGVYVEKLMEPVRHIEMQILADDFGNVDYLGERECSIQRRHQKVLEEAPSLAVGEELRRRIGEMSARAVRSLGYVGVGTLEFLLDATGSFYFLEINKRLQVEHTVTELVTGLDLVEEQLRLASGERLRHTQDQLRINGWAIDCRIQAEDPYNDFLPSAGVVTELHEPGGPGVRMDSGICKGFEVSVYYDPLIAKLAVWGKDREQAIKRMHRALRDYKILGIHNNIPFHLWLMEHPDFLAGTFDTGFLERHFLGLEQPAKQHSRSAAVVAALLEYAHQEAPASHLRSRNSGAQGWRVAGRMAQMERAPR